MTRAYGSAIAISSLATQFASRRPYLLLAVQDARKDAVATLKLVSASEGASPTSLKLIAIALSALKFDP